MSNDEYEDNYEYDSTENDENENDNKNLNNNQNNIGSIIMQAKNLWDIYNAFNTAWNVIANPQLNNNNNLKKILNENLTNFNDLNQTKLTTKNQINYQNLNLIDKINNTNLIENNIPLNKRDASDKLIEEGRYIKGDPLKGYYDFIITEGSYKFWAAFQLATAVLIIYSTFAAIYYSKVNPLVGDYDYVDYLGGGRSLSDDTDFIDDTDDIPYKNINPTRNDNIYDNENNYSLNKLLPKLGHSVKFILESIDKLPNND